MNQPSRTAYECTTWSLEPLLSDSSDATVAAVLEELEDQVSAFASHRDQLPDLDDPAALLDLVVEYESLVEKAAILGAYGSLWFSADTQSTAALAYRNRVQQALTEAHNRTLFFSLWWQGLEDERAVALLDGMRGDGAADRRFYLKDLRRFSRYRLDEQIEQVINLKDSDGISALTTLYSVLTNGFEYRPAIEGLATDRPLTRDELMAYAFSPDSKVRAETYRELYRVYETQATVLSQMYVHRVRDWHNENVTLRGYSSALAVRNVANDIDDDAIDALIDVARENTGIFQRYFERKAEWLGVDRLSRYDLYAPLADSDESVEYGDAVSLVLDTFTAFDERFGAEAERVFRQGHIDAAVRPGKKGGAFCATVSPRLTPWVLVNYAGRLRDVATVAHEMGHAVHSMFAQEHTVLTQQPSLPLAETASVFAEILVRERLLRERQDPKVQRELLASAIDDVYATVMRQAYFVLFERAAHQAILENRGFEDLCELYLENLAEQFGDSLDVAEEFKYEWLAIPHIFATPFYCYAYSFGQLLVLALYRRYQEEGDAFKPRYLELLAAGGSQRPCDVLARVGVEISDPEFWRGGFRVVEEMLAQLESLEG